MPSYRKTSKYSVATTQELTMRALGVLADSGKPMTIDEICAADMGLHGQTTQKMARVLNELVEKGVAFKTQSKARKRMIYVSAQAMADQGYDINNLVC